MQPGVLLTDAHARSAVGTVECLSRHGYRVGAGTSDPPAPGQWSRRVSERFKLSNPRHDPSLFATQVAEAASGGRFITVLPGSDASLLALSDHRELFAAEVRLGLPPREVVDRCLNKLSLVEYAAEAGLASPEGIICADPDDARFIAARLGYPLVIKPRRTVFGSGTTLRQRQSILIQNDEELLKAVPDFGLPCLLQRFQPGDTISFAAVAAGDQLLAIAFSRYIRTWPAGAGPVSFSRTETPRPELVRRVTGLIRALGWQGIFELELIERSAGGYATIDFNPRLYGSIALAARAGAPIASAWCDWLLRGDVEDHAAIPGVYYRWEEAEIRNALLRLRQRRPRQALAVARPRRPLTRAYLRWSDPAPALAMGMRLVRSRLADLSARAQPSS